MTDRLDLTNAIESAGIERKAAEHIAATIFDWCQALGRGGDGAQIGWSARRRRKTPPVASTPRSGVI